MSKDSVHSLLDFPLGDLRDYMQDNGFKKFNADQIFRWLYKDGEFDKEKWSNLSKSLKNHLEEHFQLSLLKIKWQGEALDGTEKFLLELQDGESIETVLIKSGQRLTLCISSQVGCAMKCSFCHTGTQGLKRHLKTSEIVGQLVTVKNWLRKSGKESQISNIVFMGQGEPLHNYEAVKKATEIFLEPIGLFFGQRKITLSTSGLVPMIKKLGDFPPINLAISLHSPRDSVRDELMPINKAYNLKLLFETLKEVPLKPQRSITYEYLMIDGVTNTDEDLRLLVKKLCRKTSKINLIPFNEYPGSKYKRPSDESIREFANKLNAQGLVCTVRESKGQDILAACGQLKTQKEKINTW